jgi:hypothetical protein
MKVRNIWQLTGHLGRALTKGLPLPFVLRRPMDGELRCQPGSWGAPKLVAASPSPDGVG